MDGDPAAEPELDSFGLILPLPYRVAVIFVLGLWAWGANLHYLQLQRIDVLQLINYTNRSSNLSLAYLRVYRLAAIATIPLLLSIFLFWLLTHGQAVLVAAWDVLPQSYLVILAALFLLPLQQLSPIGRRRFLSSLRRVSIGGIAEAGHGKFGDILLADVLTSYSKVLGDWFIAGCMFFTPGISSTDKPDRACGGAYMVPFIIAIPSLIRFRQCLIEFGRVRRHRIAGAGWGGQHLANALKYSSAFPVIILSAMQRGTDPADFGTTATTLFRLWLLAIFVNSMYSFYWDVAKDWDLTLFSADRDNPEHAFGLRRQTLFHAPQLYYAAIIIDLLLRCTWSLKLSPHLDHFNDLEGSIFIIEALEVLRRWIWIFFRVETEWVRTNRGPLPDDILLGDYDDMDDSSKDSLVQT